jgi:hypothetical protein
MIIELDKVTFVNDFFSTMLPDGKYLVLNKIDESIKVENEESEIKCINISIQDDEEEIACPCVIGIDNDLLIIKTEYKEYEGKVLTHENMGFCTIEVYE